MRTRLAFWAAPFCGSHDRCGPSIRAWGRGKSCTSSHALAVLARIDTINYLRLLRLTRLILRADASSAPKIAQQRSVATEFEKRVLLFYI